MEAAEQIGILHDRYGHAATVWLDNDTNSIIIMVEDSQDGDFEVGKPCQQDPQQVCAHELYMLWRATGIVGRMELPHACDSETEDDAVIEPMDVCIHQSATYKH